MTEKGEDFVLIEKNDYFGGRLKWAYFYGKYITLGAGLIRQQDIDIQNLCQKMGLELSQSETDVKQHPSLNVSMEEMDSILKTIQDKYDEVKNELINIFCKEFLELYFPADFTNKLKKINSYNDFWTADIRQTIKYYPLREFVYHHDKTFNIKKHWSGLVEALVSKIDFKKLHLNEKVIEINWSEKKIITDKNIYQTTRLFICTNIEIKEAKLNLPPKLEKTLGEIGSVPFVRLYTYHPLGHKVDHIRVPGPLEKMIPISDKVLMSGYTEKWNADFLKNLLDKSPADGIEKINKLIHNALFGSKYNPTKCSDYIMQYWNHGVHFFKPRSGPIIRSSDNVYFVGEMTLNPRVQIEYPPILGMTANIQGWTQGAVESVNDCIKEIFH